MLARKLINTTFRPLTTEDTAGTAIAKMDAWHTHTLPVLDAQTHKAAGQISFETICNLPDESVPLSTLRLDPPVYGYGHQHIFEIARLMLHHELRFLAICNPDGIYEGVANKNDLLEAFSDLLNIGTTGSVITIAMTGQDFALSELVQLIEQEGAKILGLTVSGNRPDHQPGAHQPGEDRNTQPFAQGLPQEFKQEFRSEFANEFVEDMAEEMDDRPPFLDAQPVQVSIKLNLNDTTALVAKLRRYGYDTLSENRYDMADIDLSSRADELMHYLDL